MRWAPWPPNQQYDVSDMGWVRVASEDGYHYMPRRNDGRGYLCCDVTINERYRTIKVHRMVMESFMGATPTGFHIDHINHIKTDNRLENLVWRPAPENSADCKKTSRKGARPLTADQRQAIQVLMRYSDMGTKQIATVLSCGETTVRRVLRQSKTPV
jgi:hypothetical protein